MSHLLSTAQAQPAGFRVTNQADGVTLYRQDVAGGRPDFVLEVDLGRAEVRSVTGTIVARNAGGGPLGGDNPSIRKQSLEVFWQQARAASPSAFAVLNAQFFATAHQPTNLAFAVHADGLHLADGYAIVNEYPDQKKLLEWGGGQAWLRDWSAQRFSAVAGARNRMAGLSRRGSPKWVAPAAAAEHRELLPERQVLDEKIGPTTDQVSERRDG